MTHSLVSSSQRRPPLMTPMTPITHAARRRFLKSVTGGAVLLLPQTHPWVWAQSDGAVRLLRAPKLALVVGNSRYQASPLANPGNDAAAMGEVLKGAGFDVATHLDAAHGDLARAVQDYTQAL